MSFLKKVFAFIARYYKHPVYIAVYGATYFSSRFAFNVHFLSQEEIITSLKEGKSIIRLGDGDMVSVPLDIQHSAGRPEPLIKEWYREIISSYNKKSPYILSIPRFVNVPNSELRAMGYRKLNVWLPVKVMFLLTFNKNVSYMDAHNFYYDNYFDDIIAPVFKNKKVILVANQKMIDKQKANTNLLWKDMRYVEAPPYNAIDAYDEIVANIDAELKKHKKEDVVLFVAIGPVAKHLVFKYAHKGYQSIDIGKVAEVMFTGESIQYMV